jgi:hypothetical protein
MQKMETEIKNNEVNNLIQDKNDKEIPDDKDLFKAMYVKLMEMDKRLKEIEQKSNRPLIG